MPHFSPQPATLLMMAGLLGLSGLPALPHVAMGFSSVVAPVTASTTDVRALRYRQGPATFRSATKDVSIMAAKGWQSHPNAVLTIAGSLRVQVLSLGSQSQSHL